MSAAEPLRQEAEAVAFGPPETASMPAEARGRAKSVTEPRLLPPLPTRLPVTDSDAVSRIAGWWQWLASGGHLVAHRPSMVVARERVHAAADYEALLLKGARLLWGYAWLTLKAALNFLEWVLESPARAITAAVLITLAVLFH